MKPALVFSRGRGMLIPGTNVPCFRYLLFEHQNTFTAILQDVATGVDKPEWSAISEEIQNQNVYYRKAQVLAGKAPYLVDETGSTDAFIRYHLSVDNKVLDRQTMNRDEVEQSIGGFWKPWNP